MCYIGSELWPVACGRVSLMDCLPWLRNILYIDVWEIQKHKLYDSDSGSGLQLLFSVFTWPGESRSGKFSQNGKFGQNGKFSQNGIYVWSER